MLVASQLGLLTLGAATGLAPSYPVLAVLRFITGGFQQVATTIANTFMCPTLFRTNVLHSSVQLHSFLVMYYTLQCIISLFISDLLHSSVSDISFLIDVLHSSVSDISFS